MKKLRLYFGLIAATSLMTGCGPKGIESPGGPEEGRVSLRELGACQHPELAENEQPVVINGFPYTYPQTTSSFISSDGHSVNPVDDSVTSKKRAKKPIKKVKKETPEASEKKEEEDKAKESDAGSSKKTDTLKNEEKSEKSTST